MKPAYEIVTAAELRVGDVFKENARDWVMSAGVIDHEERCVQANVGPPFGFKTQVFRQLPPERNPDVLMRALRLAIGDEFIGSPEWSAERYIKNAIEELESEAGDAST